jgi:hypothetical protein
MFSDTVLLGFDNAEANAVKEGIGRGKSKKLLLQVLNPSYDYVPPELISLFVTGNILYLWGLLILRSLLSRYGFVSPVLRFAVPEVIICPISNLSLQTMATGLCHHTSIGS